VADEFNQVLSSFLAHHASVSSAVSYFTAAVVALLWIGMAWRVLK
jgi:hypothetical protein